jgi:hypothetical protein
MTLFRVLPLSTDLRNVSESPFTKYDKKLFGKNLFRQKFTRYFTFRRFEGFEGTF